MCKLHIIARGNSAKGEYTEIWIESDGKTAYLSVIQPYNKNRLRSSYNVPVSVVTREYLLDILRKG